MRDGISRRLLLLVAILLATAGNIFPQQPESSQSASNETPRKAMSYTFVSPNTRENLTLREALRLLNSREEHQLVNEIHSLSRCLGLRPVVNKTIGSWSDGAEHSTLFRVFTDQQTLIYEDARLGKRERQKSVLYFRQDASGAGRMYILQLRRRRSLVSISRKLDENGVAFRTLVPGPKRRTSVYVVDLNSELHKQIVTASRKLGARLSSIKGTGAFIGDDSDREKAQQVFAETINKYEAENPQVARRCAQR
ncbi:MAG TPA: hypothetical protein VF791_03670 [Pyrinomonadaceae bacterium]